MKKKERQRRQGGGREYLYPKGLAVPTTYLPRQEHR